MGCLRHVGARAGSIPVCGWLSFSREAAVQPHQPQSDGAQAAAKAADEYIAAFPLLREDMLRVREALTAELEEAAATADKAIRRREHRKRQRQVRDHAPAHIGSSRVSVNVSRNLSGALYCLGHEQQEASQRFAGIWSVGSSVWRWYGGANKVVLAIEVCACNRQSCP